jgi:plasmid stabilization system protein ParE
MKVVWSERALIDLRDIKEWIARDSASYALMVVERIVNQVESLGQMPRRGHLVPELLDETIREIHSDSYRIFYKIQLGSVGILAIVHMARQIRMDEE